MHKNAIAVAAVVLLAGCESLGFKEAEQEISLSEVPEAIMAAATGAVPGIDISEAEIEMEDGKKVYELEGTANGSRYEIEISENGEILEIEEDEDK